MKLFYLVETDSEDFPTKGSLLGRHRGHGRALAHFTSEINRLKQRFEALRKAGVIVHLHDKVTTYKNKPAEEFQSFEYVPGLIRHSDRYSVDPSWFILLSMPPDLVSKALKLNSAYKRWIKQIDQHTESHFKLRKAAASEFVGQELNQPKAQSDIADMQEHIVHYGSNHKRYYLHNPVSFYDEPHYFGPPSHYTWPEKSKVTYYMLSEQLKEHGLPPFTKVFSGVEDGETHFIVCNVDHSVVWQYDGAHDRIYIAGTAKPLKPGSLFRATKKSGPIDTGIFDAAHKMREVTITPSPHDPLPGAPNI